MSCLLHPQVPAAAACEYCTQPHCATCLRQFMGRSYCPSCFEQVYSLATGASRNGAVPGAATRIAPGSAAPGKRPSRTVIPGWLSAILYLGGFLVLEMAAGRALQLTLFVAQALAGSPPPSHRSSAAMFDASGLGAAGWAAVFGIVGWLTCFLILAYTALAGQVMERRSLSAFGLRWYARVGRDFLLGSALATLLFVSIVGVGIEFGWFSMSLALPWSQVLVVVPCGFLILLPFAAVEEISIRGFVLQSTARSWGRIGGLLASSAAFTALHASNEHFHDQPWTWLGLFLAGLYLGSAYLLTNRLWLPLFLHTAWNLLEGPVFGLPVSGTSLPVSLFRTQPVGPASWTGGSFGPEGGLLLCLLLVVHLAFLWAIRPLLVTEEAATPAAEMPPATEVRTYRAIPL